MQRYDVLRHTSYTIQENVYGEFVKYSDAQATIDRLTAELESLKLKYAALEKRNDALTSERDQLDEALEAEKAKRGAQLEAAASVTERRCDSFGECFDRPLRDDVQARIRALDPDATAALDRIVKQAVDAETQACAEVARGAWKSGYDAHPHILARLDKRKGAGI